MSVNVINRLAIIGSDDEVKQVFEYIKGEPDYDGMEMYIDFNKIVRMPDNMEYQSNFCYDWFEKDKHPHIIWSKANWECIGNAYNQKLEAENIIYFKTKGSPVINLVSLLSLRFRDVRILYYFDDGNTSACYSFLYGKCYQDTNLNCDEILYLNSLDPKSKLAFLKQKLGLSQKNNKSDNNNEK